MLQLGLTLLLTLLVALVAFVALVPVNFTKPVSRHRITQLRHDQLV